VKSHFIIEWISIEKNMYKYFRRIENETSRLLVIAILRNSLIYIS